MKTFRKNTFFASAIAMILILTAPKASAQENGNKSTKWEAKVENVGKLKFKVTIENPLRQKTNMAITDESKNILFSEYALNTPQYSRVFDLSDLNDGKITFELWSPNGKINQEFEIQTKVDRVVLAKQKK